ncbi:MAG: adenosylcobinamide-phosphate synthase CbiB [Prevotellaceae bacterium]|nr:adenosylcobinamide-phosphate synthase CbiB [Prevotella sp.]MDD7257754.1 adenosylcobinamide-phosphate synthase CbiB [Prevotellaceae bacterium]MDY6130511.1 adenosylcobinamide-phosphate synthase CbiB [Prevotella sp.]
MNFALLTGWLADKLLGDPSWLPHPIVWFGKTIAAGERLLNRNGYRRLKGGLLAVLLILLTFMVVLVLLGFVFRINEWAGLALGAILVFYGLAGTTLVKEVRMVFEAADRSLEEGRRQVGRIVGRDTSQLDDQEIRKAALETLAENLSDGVVAPLFWLALLGIPGMMAYKMINTLDSMIGYRTERYKRFGTVAAVIDDVANYIPARLTALLMVLVAGKPQLVSFVRRFGRQHASPNSGYPESALAGILGCRFGGTHTYFGEIIEKPYIGETDRAIDSDDMRRAVRINLWVEMVMVALVFLSQMLISR